MRVAFDTNVLLDVILNRPSRDVALQLMYAAARGEITGIVSANSITDIYYMSRRGIGDAGAREAVADILAICDVAVVDGEACYLALELPMKDYEDAVLAVCAEREGADYIATRDEDFIGAEGSPVPAMRPEDVLRVIRGAER